ncbi:MULTISPECIES: hypothetical protein [Aurantimonas]|uniref:hypothetical protein n=1 Tax=Aurantimonas TaxID=182269 RepID=UPI00351768A0
MDSQQMERRWHTDHPDAAERLGRLSGKELVIAAEGLFRAIEAFEATQNSPKCDINSAVSNWFEQEMERLGQLHEMVMAEAKSRPFSGDIDTDEGLLRLVASWEMQTGAVSPEEVVEWVLGAKRRARAAAINARRAA